VGASFQNLDNQQVACGLKLGPAAILNQNPIFEMPSKKNIQRTLSPDYSLTLARRRFFYATAEQFLAEYTNEKNI